MSIITQSVSFVRYQKWNEKKAFYQFLYFLEVVINVLVCSSQAIFSLKSVWTS